MMKVLPSGAISRLSLRIGERRQKKKDGQTGGMTTLDEDNVSEFDNLISAAIQLLDLENEALVSGDIARVAEFYNRKNELLINLAQKQPLVEPFLKEDTEQVKKLCEKIRKLADRLQDNGKLLEGMSNASRAVVNEVERLRKRQSLDGMYDKTGQLIRGLNKISSRVVKNI